jgi:hypothetical protein
VDGGEELSRSLPGVEFPYGGRGGVKQRYTQGRIPGGGEELSRSLPRGGFPYRGWEELSRVYPGKDFYMDGGEELSRGYPGRISPGGRRREVKRRFTQEMISHRLFSRRLCKSSKMGAW